MTIEAPRTGRMRGRTVFITGAAGGIGSVLAHRFAQEGARVVCADYDGASTLRLAKEIGGEALGLELDVTDENQVKDVITQVARLHGLDVLCNVAGIAGPQMPMDQTDADAWDATFAVNTRGTFLTIKHAVPFLRERGGNIVNIASALAQIGWRSESAYGPSKAAVVQMTKSAALDLAPDVRANAVLPGAVLTPMITAMLDDADMEQVLREYGMIHPLGQQLINPSAIADAVIFLASDDASFVTGACIPVDAGMLATGRSAVDRHGNETFAETR